MKKIVITEKQLTELKIRPSDQANIVSGSADVYIGKNIVKKVGKYGAEFTERNLKQYKLMEQYPNFFPKTKIVQSKEYPYYAVVQEKLDAETANKIYRKIDKHLDFEFRYFIEDVANYGIGEYIEERKNHIKALNKNAPELLDDFKQIVQLVNGLHFLIKKHAKDLDNASADLNNDNFGINKNGEWKVFDFIHPMR